MNKKKTIVIGAVCLWMFLIFSFSSQAAEQTNQLSLKITQKIIDMNLLVLPDGVEPDAYLLLANRWIRKAAHFFLFMILGFLISQVLNVWVKNRLYTSVVSLIISAAYAVSDEYHQMFVPGRNAAWKDVFIDTIGAVLGILLSLLIIQAFKKRKVK